jgi:Mg/Co/Ni transporter MgtE
VTLSALLKRLLRREPVVEEIEWRQVEPLMGHVPTARKGLPFPRLAQLKPAEIADIVEQASHDEGEQILDAVREDEEFEADVFEELDEGHRVEFLKDRSDAEAAEVLSNMEPDHAADLLMLLPQERRLPILELLEPNQQRKVRALLGYHPESAGGLMNNEFVAMPAGELVGEALVRLRHMAELPAILTDVYVLEGEQLAGSLALSRLLRADPERPLREVMQADPEAVFADADLPSVAVLMADFNLASLPVIDSTGRLVGIVTYDDLIEAMLPDEWRWRGRPAAARFEAAASGAPPAARRP